MKILNSYTWIVNPFLTSSTLTNVKIDIAFFPTHVTSYTSSYLPLKSWAQLPNPFPCSYGWLLFPSSHSCGYLFHVCPLQDFTVLLTKIFCCYVIKISLVFIYRRPHRRNTSVGFPFIGNTRVRRYICWKNKKNICQWFYRRNLHIKKSFQLEIYRRIYPIGDSVTYRW